MKSVDLCEKYSKLRDIILSEDEFSIMATIFPAVLVATADHLFDAEEKEYIADLVANAAIELYDDEVKAYRLAELLFKELLFLSQVNNEWQEKFLSVLQEELENEDKSALKKMLLQTAEVNKKMSDEEKSEIDRILKYVIGTPSR